jgi:thiamine pyrophosphokinase
MGAMKIHSLKEAEAQAVRMLLGQKRLLVLGPLDLERAKIEQMMKKLKPSAIVFVDGGMIHKKKLKTDHKIFFLSVGDGDSVGVGLTPDIYLPAEKDLSDLAFVLKCLKKISPSEVIFLGFSGKKEERPDHFLFNIGEVERFAATTKIQVRLDQFIFIPPGKNQMKISGLFSLFTLAKTSVRLTGKVRYPLIRWTTLRPLSSLGLSNEASGRIVIETNKTLILYLAGEKIN